MPNPKGLVSGILSPPPGRAHARKPRGDAAFQRNSSNKNLRKNKGKNRERLEKIKKNRERLGILILPRVLPMGGEILGDFILSFRFHLWIGRFHLQKWQSGSNKWHGEYLRWKRHATNSRHNQRGRLGNSRGNVSSSSILIYELHVKSEGKFAATKGSLENECNTLRTG